MIASKPELLKYFDIPNPSLRAILQRNEVGIPDDYRTPFWHGNSRASVLEKWQKVVDSQGIDTKYHWIYEYEMEMKAKVGPLSIIRPFSARAKDVEDYFTSVELPSKAIESEAVAETEDYFNGINGLTIRGQQSTWDKMRKDTSSGAPLLQRRLHVASATIPAACEPPNHLYTPKWRGLTSAIMFSRGQEGGPKPSDVKNRVIWGMPVGVNLCELQFYQPMIEACQRKNLIPAWVGNDAVDDAITHLFDEKAAKDDIVCTDFTKYDQHFNPHMQQVARDIYASLLGDADHPWLMNVFPVKYGIPLVCTEQVMYQGPHGMASGSGGTNADETVTHKSLQFETALHAGEELNPFSQCLGDDGLLSYPGIKVKDVIATYTAHGQEMNISKQEVSNTTCTYLRRKHNVDYRVDGKCVGVYSTFRALGRLLGQERYYDPEKWGPKMVTLRAWSILENAKWNPLFEPLVDFVLETGDKYQLGLGIPGFIDDVENIANKANENFKDFLGFNQSNSLESRKKGIKDWTIYKYLSEKSRA